MIHPRVAFAQGFTMDGGAAFRSLRDRFLAPGAAARAGTLRWPEATPFNWARDFFDPMAAANERPALRVVGDEGPDLELSFAELARRSSQVARFLADRGVGHGDRLLVMLGNVVPLWEVMLAAIKLGAVVIPASTLLTPVDLEDRLTRGRVKAVVTEPGLTGRFAGLEGPDLRIAIGAAPAGWVDYALSRTAPATFAAATPTAADDPLLLYFTSGTTARPKLVLHTQTSYPVGHLTTLLWLGLKPGDVHLNLSSPGWAKHAWSCLFAPWNAEATVLAYQFERFSAPRLLDQLVRCQVTTFCAPPTVWRMLIQEDLARWPVTLREVTAAGEPLNPAVIEAVESAWALTIRDGFGQTETTAMVGNLPGQPVKPGSMGRPLPGYPVVLLDADGAPAEAGEICLDLRTRPVGLMAGYLDDPTKNAEVMRAGYYHTGDVAERDEEGYLTYVGRSDDVFKSSDYRISPFELESVLIEHADVAEAAVVPSPDALRLSVPKAFIVTNATPCAALARSILAHVRERVPPFKRIRRIEFRELPKTISGKIRRVDLRRGEEARPADAPRRALEFWEEDLVDGATQGAASDPGRVP